VAHQHQHLRVRVVATPTARPLPLHLLTRRDPFLLFRSLTLYADDLHDRGQAEVAVKVRVMPSCFLVLLRSYLRIDHERVALRDVRYCGVFDAEGTAGRQQEQATQTAQAPAMSGDDRGGGRGEAATGDPATLPVVVAAASSGGGGGGVAAAYPRHLQGAHSVPTDGAAAAAAAAAGDSAAVGGGGGRITGEGSARSPLAVTVLKNVQLRRADAATVRQVRVREQQWLLESLR
jgi:hypothetical protein